jgi:hypothetical protein
MARGLIMNTPKVQFSRCVFVVIFIFVGHVSLGDEKTKQDGQQPKAGSFGLKIAVGRDVSFFTKPMA